MEIKEILSRCDHTALAVTATMDDIKKLIDDGIKYGTASVCIPPCFVRPAVEYSGGKVKICTVIGFPNGYNSTAVKVFETADAVSSGADEIDMVINVGWLKDKKYDLLLEEIKSIKKACGDKILKVIVETCLLTDEEKVKISQIVTQSGADYIKTSTGFSLYGATEEDVSILVKSVGAGVKVKASGGIKGLSDAEKFIALGADRLGTSKVVSAVKKLEEK